MNMKAIKTNHRYGSLTVAGTIRTSSKFLAMLLLLLFAVQVVAAKNPVVGKMPAIGSQAPDFKLTNTDLEDVSLKDYTGYNIILNIFPSIDTPVCAASVRQFNERAESLGDTKVLAVSMDLPFAMKRYCAALGLDNTIALSAFRSPSFGKDYGVLIPVTPLRGLFARAVVVINKEGKVVYTEFVPDISNEPDYEAALKAVSK